MPPSRSLGQNSTGEFPAMQLLLEQIIANQDKLELKLERVQDDVGDIKETLRDGSGQFDAVNNWQKGHDSYHAIKDEEAKAGPHWLVKSSASAAAGALAVSLVWFVVRGVSDNGPVRVQRTERNETTITKDSR